MGYYGHWAPYVPVAERREMAAKKIKQIQKEGITFNPINIIGRPIAKTFWGKAWCDHLENYSDYDNRLPRGRTYLRNGSVIDLQVSQGQVKAQVMGSSLYQVSIQVKPMQENKWKKLVTTCAGKIDSLVELLQGKFSKAIMSIFISKDSELFSSPQEISMSCSCPDYAGMCKHIAAVLYGIGAAIDTKPQWLFQLRHVDHLQLIASAASSSSLLNSDSSTNTIAEDSLSSIFGVELESETPKIAVAKAKKNRLNNKRRIKPAKKQRLKSVSNGKSRR